MFYYLWTYLTHIIVGTMELNYLEFTCIRRGISKVEGLIDHTEVSISKLLRLGQWPIDLLHASANSKRDVNLISGGHCESKILVCKLCDKATLIVAMRWAA